MGVGFKPGQFDNMIVGEIVSPGFLAVGQSFAVVDFVVEGEMIGLPGLVRLSTSRRGLSPVGFLGQPQQ